MSFERHNRGISRRQFLQGSAAIAAASLLAACAPATPTAAPAIGETPAAAKGGSIVVGTVGDLTNLDPFVMTFVNYPMMENVYDQFIRLDNNVQPSPAVIEHWETSTDGKTLTLKVRQGVQYHDGSGTVTAYHIAQCIRRATVPEMAGNQYPNWQTVTDVQVSGNDTVVVTFQAPAAFIIPAMGFISAINPASFEGLKSKEGGTGPFKVKEWIPNDYLDMEKFADYWDTGKPFLDSARVRFFADSAAMIAALEAGTIDAAISVPPREYERLKDSFNIMRGQDAANFYFLGMAPTHPPFDKKEVRQALAHAVDKETMTKNVLFGISEPISIPWPRFSFAYFEEFENRYPYDLDKAKQMLVDAGYPNGIEFGIETPNNFPEFGQFAEILKASLAQIGSTVNITPMDPAQWYPILIDANYQAIFSFAGGTQWYPTRITLSNNFAATGNRAWPNGTPPKDWTEGLMKADASFDPAVQKEGMRQAVAAFVEECWVVPIAFRYTLFATQKYVSGLGHGVYDQLRLMETTVNK